MDYKEEDNKTTDIKKQINEIDNLIDNEKSKIKQIDSMQESAVSISKSMNKCIDLLSESIKGPNSKNKYNDMRNSNRKTYVNISTMLDEENEITMKQINKLYEQKESVLKEQKK